MTCRFGGVCVNRVAMTLAGIALVAQAALGQPPSEPPRRGGLLPGRPAESAVPVQTREELMRSWDLNADGTIDEAEAEIARTKMRRERVKLLQRSSSRPAAVAGETEEAATDDDLLFPDQPPPAKAPAKKRETATADKKPVDASDPRTPTTRDLNAGRLPAGLPPARGIPTGMQPPGRAGLGLGSRSGTQPPQATAADARRLGPSATPAMRPPRPPAPTRPVPTFPARPRVTAEEMGGP
jgi:hypothetical protein